METNTLDIIVLAIVALTAVRGLIRGLSRELADLIRIVGSVLLAYFFYQPLAVLILDKTRLTEVASSVTAFILILIGSFLLFTIIHYFLSKFMQFAFKGQLERIGGLASGVIKGSMFAVIVVFLVSFWPHVETRRAVREGSLCGRWVTAYYPTLYTNIVKHCPAVQEMQRSFTNDVQDVIRDDFEELKPPSSGPKTDSEESETPAD